VNGRTVQIDAVGGSGHHFVQEKVGQLRGQRAFQAAGKAAIEVAAIRQIAAVADEAERVDDRHDEQSPAADCQRLGCKQAAADRYPRKLVTMTAALTNRTGPSRLA
jgi:hypothetical protein